jgi:hypothetical protein
VNVKGIEEEDNFGHSSFYVFQKLSSHSRDAIEFFSMSGESPLLRFFAWMNSYVTLFSEKCRFCGKILANDTSVMKFLPPTFRTFEESHVYHSHCYELFKKKKVK